MRAEQAQEFPVRDLLHALVFDRATNRLQDGARRGFHPEHFPSPANAGLPHNSSPGGGNIYFFFGGRADDGPDASYEFSLPPDADGFFRSTRGMAGYRALAGTTATGSPEPRLNG